MSKTPLTLRQRFGTGFTILELLVVSILMAMVVMITTQFWTWFSPSITDIIARGHTLREARMAMQNLADDFGAAVGAAPVGSDRLVLCKDGGDFPNGAADWAAPDVLVDYFIADNSLYRSDLSAGVEFVVADSVSDFTVEQISPTLVRITLQWVCRDSERQLVFMWSQP
jgi:type II secretory pathway pseudopilin PulG